MSIHYVKPDDPVFTPALCGLVVLEHPCEQVTVLEYMVTCPECRSGLSGAILEDQTPQ